MLTNRVIRGGPIYVQKVKDVSGRKIGGLLSLLTLHLCLAHTDKQRVTCPDSVSASLPLAILFAFYHQ